MKKIAVVGAGAGGAAAVVELVAAGYQVALWGRSEPTLKPFADQGGIAYEGVLGAGLAKPHLITTDMAAAIDGADAMLVCLPTFAHADIADLLSRLGVTIPVILNPGHTGGALEFRQCFESRGTAPPPIAEFSTLTYVARQYAPGSVTVTGRAKSVRLAALPGGEAAADAAR